MNPEKQQDPRPDEDDVELAEEDVVEVVEDDGPAGEPMSDDEFDGYDGEIVIGAPAPGEEEEYMRSIENGEDMEGVETMEDNSWSASAVHKPQQSLFALALHPMFPNPPIAVSGGEDDMAYIYAPLPPAEGDSDAEGIHADSFSPVALDGHTDSVVATAWSFNGEMVATGGMDGHVRVYAKGEDWAQWGLVADLEADSEIQWLRWHPKGPVLAAGCEDSTVWMWQLPSGNTMTVLSGHTMPVTTGEFPPPNGRQLLTASLDSTLILWNPTAGTPMFKLPVFCGDNASELDPSVDGITSLAVSPNGALAAVGSAGGEVKLISLPKGDIVGKLVGHNEGESVEALVFVDILAGAGGGKGTVLVSGGVDGKGFVWDVHTGRVRAELKHDEAITSIAAHPAPCLHLVTSASADRTLKTWDIRTGTLVAEHKGHTGVINGVSVAPLPASETSATGQPQAQAIVTAGDEGVSLVFKV